MRNSAFSYLCCRSGEGLPVCELCRHQRSGTYVCGLYCQHRSYGISILFHRILNNDALFYTLRGKDSSSSSLHFHSQQCVAETNIYFICTYKYIQISILRQNKYVLFDPGKMINIKSAWKSSTIASIVWTSAGKEYYYSNNLDKNVLLKRYSNAIEYKHIVANRRCGVELPEVIVNGKKCCHGDMSGFQISKTEYTHIVKTVPYIDAHVWRTVKRRVGNRECRIEHKRNNYQGNYRCNNVIRKSQRYGHRDNGNIRTADKFEKPSGDRMEESIITKSEIKCRRRTDKNAPKTQNSGIRFMIANDNIQDSGSLMARIAQEEEDADDSDEDQSSDEEDNDAPSAKVTRIRTSIKWIDNFLIIWHAMFLILFLFLIALGVLLRVYFGTIIEKRVKSSPNYVYYSHFVKIETIPESLSFGDLSNVLGESLIVLSCIYIGCVIFYMTFLLHRVTFTLPIVVIVSGAVVLTEVNIINIYMSPVSAANEEAKKELKARAEKEYAVDSDNVFSVTYDIISIWGECCGIVDQYDFQNVILKYFLPTQREQKTLQVPPTCCKPSVFKKGVDFVVDCASTAEDIFLTGCYQQIYLWLRVYCNAFSIVVVLQLTDLCIHIILYKKHLNLLTLQLKK